MSMSLTRSPHSPISLEVQVELWSSFRWKSLTGILGCVGSVDETEDECSVENAIPVFERLSHGSRLKKAVTCCGSIGEGDYRKLEENLSSVPIC